MIVNISRRWSNSSQRMRNVSSTHRFEYCSPEQKNRSSNTNDNDQHGLYPKPSPHKHYAARAIEGQANT